MRHQRKGIEADATHRRRREMVWTSRRVTMMPPHR
jgi:hypothetical protein